MSDAGKQEVEWVDVQIDGEWHKVPKGARIIEACRQAGKEIPHYCYHPKLSSPGNCRMCLVEMGMPPRPRPGEALPGPDAEGHVPIAWMPRPVIACANTVAPNMGIRTDSELTRACRQGVMELLLINHPLDCPICDQAGECALQEFSVEHGKGRSRFRENKVKKPKNVAVGPRVRLDDERCILCSRCIRFTSEIADDPVLGLTERGSHTVLTVYPGQQLANNYSLNTVDICPVGALTSNDFRFQMRVWFMKEVNSICTGCARGCNVVIASREDKIYRLTPRENNEVNSAWMCDEGRLRFHQFENEVRLLEPLERVKDDEIHRFTPWPEAIARSAESLGRFQKGEIAIIGSGRSTNEELVLLRQLSETLGVDLIDIVPHPCPGDDYLFAPDRNPNTTGAKVILGLDRPGSRLEEIRKGIEEKSIKALIAVRENLLTEEAGFGAHHLEELDFFLVIDLLANPTAEKAEVVLPGASFAERSGSMINATGRLQRLIPAVDLPGNTREDWKILRDLLLETGGGNGVFSIEDVFRLLAETAPEFAGLTFGQIGDLGIPLIETDQRVPLLERERERVARREIVG